MIGRSRAQDQPVPAYDPIGRFGAAALYQPAVARPYRTAPWNRVPGWVTLAASNKPSEHNIGNQLRVIQVAQLAGQTQPANLRTLYSNRILLRPGNQSLGST